MKFGSRIHTPYATTAVDMENHQIVDILPTRNDTEVAGWIDKQHQAWKDTLRSR